VIEKALAFLRYPKGLPVPGEAVEDQGFFMESKVELVKVRVNGSGPLLMHSDRLANPLAKETVAHKALTSKRKKVEDDHIAIARSEFLASCYFNEADGIHVPGICFDAAFLAGAKLQKMGVHWKRGALVMETAVRLLYEGPKTPEGLWESPEHVDVRGVRVGAAKLMRYRPVFRSWAAELSVSVNTEVLDLAAVKRAMEDAGRLIGVCDYRPRFGRFEVSYG